MQCIHWICTSLAVGEREGEGEREREGLFTPDGICPGMDGWMEECGSIMALQVIPKLSARTMAKWRRN